MASESDSGDDMAAKAAVFSQNMVLLPEQFAPGEYDVICGRGRKCFNHPGNAKFRELVAGYLEKYSNAAKLEKSYILSDIVNKVRQDSPTGGFVKKDPLSGRWHEVGDFLAREKTSQAFRDALHDQYKSSNTAKKKRRQAEQAEKLYRDHSSRSLGVSVSDDSSYQSEQSASYVSNNSSKFMRVNRLEGTQDSLLGALDNDIAVQFGGGGGVENNRKMFASQRSARSVLDVGQVSSATTPPWFNRSCPNLNNIINIDAMTIHSESEDDNSLHPPSSNTSWADQSQQQQQGSHHEHHQQRQSGRPPRRVLCHPSYSRHSQPNLFAPKLGQIDEGDVPMPTNLEWMHHSQPNLLGAFPPIEERKELLSPQAGMTVIAGGSQSNLISNVSPLPLTSDDSLLARALAKSRQMPKTPIKTSGGNQMMEDDDALPLCSPIGDGSTHGLFERLAHFAEERSPSGNGRFQPMHLGE